MSSRFVFVVLVSFALKISQCDGSTMNGSVRLVNGGLASEGRVEVYINGEWGTVCDDGWDLLGGKVVCMQLGYINASEVSGDAVYGEGSGPIHFDGLNCFGNETNLTQCQVDPRKQCQHIHDAGVACYPPAESGGLSDVLIGVIVLVPFLILIILIILAICAMVYLTFKYDRVAFEEEENERRIRRFARGLTLKEQSMLATKGKKGFFRSSRRRSDLPAMSGSSSYVERPNIPRAALGEGLPHPWQLIDELESNLDEEEEIMQEYGANRHMRIHRTVEAFNPNLMSATKDTAGVELTSSSVPVRYRKDKDYDNSDDDSDYNPYENEPKIII